MSKHFGIVRSGDLVYDDPIKRKKAIDKLEGFRFELVLSKEKNLRTNKENSYYWAVILKYVKTALTESQGEKFTAKEAHEFMKIKFLGVKKVKIKNTHITIIPSTKKLTTIQTENYYDSIRKWMFTFFEIVVPLPNEDLEWLKVKKF